MRLARLNSIMVLHLDRPTNGSWDVGAIVTRVWGQPEGDSPGQVNLMVFPDQAAPYPLGSVPLYETKSAAERLSELQGVVQYCYFQPD